MEPLKAWMPKNIFCRAPNLSRNVLESRMYCRLLNAGDRETWEKGELHTTNLGRQGLFSLVLSSPRHRRSNRIRSGPTNSKSGHQTRPCLSPLTIPHLTFSYTSPAARLFKPTFPYSCRQTVERGRQIGFSPSTLFAGKNQRGLPFHHHNPDTDTGHRGRKPKHAEAACIVSPSSVPAAF